MKRSRSCTRYVISITLMTVQFQLSVSFPQKNLADIDICREGAERKLAVASKSDSNAGFAPIGAVKSDTESASKYKDRAMERRAVFGADNPTPKPSTSDGTGKPEAPRAPEPVRSAEEKPIDSSNIGSRMLAMMGWTPGQGLGASGQGQTGIIETKIYDKGAGLGSGKAGAPSKMLAHTEGGRKGYLHAAKQGEYRH